MKKYFLFMSVLASLFLAGCSQEEIAPDGEDNGSGEANTSYMAVNLMSSDVKGTRAAAGYEDGSVDENKVTGVRFYFFNGVGGAVNVKLQNGGGYVNYYDWNPKLDSDSDPVQSDDTNKDDDIESKLKAIIVINTATGDGIPQRIAAVINPTDLEDKSMSLTELKDAVNDYATSNLTSKGYFVMFNAVYASGGAQVSTVAITDDNLCKTPEEASENPVTIYVERSVAKVRVTLDNKMGYDTDQGLALKDKEGKDLTIDGKQVYLKLGGWGLTAETSESRLVKKIDPGWAYTWWNGTHRSFWAINSMKAQNRYHNYSSISTSFGVDNALYTNENAQLTDIDGVKGKATKKTKVILKGQLCKEDGTSFTIVRHLGVHFADNANLFKLKESILNQLAVSGHNYYYKKENEREQIGTDDLQIVIASQQEYEESQNNCYVYTQLTDAAKTKEWYNSLEENAQPIVDAATEINGKLADKKVVDRALVWKDGMTYYFYEIRHLDTEKGVVRNHIYETNVTKIAGLGTPVYDPEKVIYPEIPDPNAHFIAAQINILSWRLVKNDYELKW